jgi:hypothetical protein
MEALLQLYNLRARLDVKYEMDSGVVEAEATDVSGTPVLLNKPFKDVDSITLSVESITEQKAVYDFVDIPNPTGFSVYVFDAAGVRVDATVSWIVRGVR